MDYSLADIVMITGGKRRSVQLWAEAGAIVAYPKTDKRGTGTHRRFSRDEVIVACCLNGLARRQVGIGELIRIGKGLRAFLNRGKDRAAIEEAMSPRGDWESYLAIIWPEEGNPQVLLLQEEDLSPVFGDGVKGHGLAVLLPLKKTLAGLNR